jgi:putative FmdB family regulatory protein
LPNYDFECPKCGVFEVFAHMKDIADTILCKCGKRADRLVSLPAITGTRDGFGIGRNFIHENENGSKEEITTWREWEKKGYKDATTSHKGDMREKIKENMDKRRRKAGQKLTIGV